MTDGPAEPEPDDSEQGEIVGGPPGIEARTTPPDTASSGRAPGTLNVNVGVFASYISQLPPASEVAQLESIQPGTLDRLLRLQEAVGEQAKVEQTHRHGLEDADSKLKRDGQRIAAGAFLVAMLVTLILALTGHDGAAEVVGGATAVGVVGTFVTGKVFSQAAGAEDGSEEDG